MVARAQIPNLLTIARVASVPLCLAIILGNSVWKAAALLVIFIAAALTDFLDGYLARKWKVISPLGAMLDPIADKLLVALMLVYLLVAGDTLPYVGAPGMIVWDGENGGGKVPAPPYWFMTTQPLFLPIAVILLRELYISGLREYLANRQIKLPVSKGGKWKTALQMTAIIALLAAFAMAQSDKPCGILFEHLAVECGQSPLVRFARIGGMATLYVSAMLAITSAIGYTRAAWKHLR